MNKILVLFLSVITLSVIQCCTNSNAFHNNPNTEPAVNSNDHLTMAILYQQSSAEYRALCYQAFNIAKYRLDQSTRIMGMMKKAAVVVDIDETVLDNSPYEANTILKNWIYPEGWDEWIEKASANAVPGAVEFLKYAESKGVETYYISNRKESQRTQTLKNLISIGFPFATDDHLLLKDNESSKKTRRGRVSEIRFIIMLIGDNLNDFSEIFEQKSIPERFGLADSLNNEFGNRFIILPNAMYGDWEGALYNYDYSMNAVKKDEIRKSKLQGF
ncbi:MAG: 5'-nucleotidase, lipoprotein e(P4) family [Bacteroidetes bacterium]|nr:5'-nucleotidase, lipoprotein e(P4) family [Bacteroidota bacterium]